MRFKLILIGLFCVLEVTNAQVSNEGRPLSWDLKVKENISPVVMKGYDVNKIKAEDVKNDLNKSIPWRFGYEYKVNLGLDNSGTWEELLDGSRIWRIKIVSEGAKTLNFVFNTYKIPRGATVYLYNDDRTDVLGAYTNVFNRPDGMLGTWLVKGDRVWVEYHEPANVKGEGRLNIGSVVHGYRSVGSYESSAKALNDSGDCNQDVNCTVGSDFDSLKDKLKKAVGIMIVGSSGFCTGTLINNTNNDKSPYFLTANHCAGGESSWAFRFNWISTNTVCAATDNSVDNGSDNYYQTTSGARVLAKNAESDVELIEITGGLDQSWDLEWAGWDRTGNVPNFAVGIHHPSGDIMKVCRENAPLSTIKTEITGLVAPVASWQVSDWDIGVTERGSSGSALFDPSGRIVGQLAGGGAACNGVNDNNNPDYYGRFDVSWDFGTTDETRLSNWLDSSNTGRETLDMLSEETSTVNPPVEEEEIFVFFDSSKAIVTISNNARKILDYVVYNMLGQQIGSGQLSEEEENIDIKKGGSGMYFVYITNTSDGTSFTKKVIVNQRF